MMATIDGSIRIQVGGEVVLRIASGAEAQPSARITAYFAGFQATGASPMAYTLPNDKPLDVGVTYFDAKGNSVDIAAGSVKWETSDTSILTVTPNATDDQIAQLTAGANLGNAQVTNTATNVDGSQVIATLDVTVVAGSAVTGTIAPVEPMPVQAKK